MHVLVTGGRDYRGDAKVFAVLNTVTAWRPVTRIIHGGATGADEFADQWAHSRKIPVGLHEADWNRYGNFAGGVRNQRMLDIERVDLVVAFPGRSGTRDMRDRATAAGIPVLRIR